MVVDRPVPADVRARIAAGMNDDDIRSELDLTHAELEDLKRVVIEEDLFQVRHRSPEQVYVEYRTRMMRIAGDLLDVSVEARDARQFNAAMGALKAEATVIDKMIDRGQDLGVLPRAARQNTHTVTGGLVIGSMTDRELSDRLRDQAQERKRLKAEYGDAPFAELPEPSIYPDPDILDAPPPEPVQVQAPSAPARKPVR